MEFTPPFIVSVPPDCLFYRTVEKAVTAGLSSEGDVFDAHGLRLSATADGPRASSVETDELVHLLRRWLGHVEALGEPTTSWPLWLLVHVAVERAGYEL